MKGPPIRCGRRIDIEEEQRPAGRATKTLVQQREIRLGAGVVFIQINEKGADALAFRCDFLCVAGQGRIKKIKMAIELLPRRIMQDVGMFERVWGESGRGSDAGAR